MKFFAFFFGKKNGLQKFQGKFYVSAARLSVIIFGNPLQKFFFGFGFVEFLMRSAPFSERGLGFVVFAVYARKATESASCV
jgi:hypothetical protein